MREETSSKLALGYTLELVGDRCVIRLHRVGEVIGRGMGKDPGCTATTLVFRRAVLQVA
jgi:hypothetical protein